MPNGRLSGACRLSASGVRFAIRERRQGGGFETGSF